MRAACDEQEAIDYIVQLIYARTHIRLHSGKEPLIRARLGKRQRALALVDLASYARYLQTSGDEGEITAAVDALTTNFTHFLRENDHFRFLVDTIIPELTGGVPGTIRLWSAACATGEEPFTMAFYLEEHFPVARGWDWRVLATDVSTRALAKAREAIFPEDRVSAIPLEWQRRYLRRGVGVASGLYQVKGHLRERIEFRHENLLAEHRGNEVFHAIFCRNVMIYFDRPTQEKLMNSLCRHLQPGGYVLVGHSESLTGLSVPLRCLRPSYYRLR